MLQTRPTPARKTRPATPARRAIAKFRSFYPAGFEDVDYIELERSYKERAHEQWMNTLSPKRLGALIRSEEYEAVAAEAVRIESRTNLLFSFEKMALRDAVRSRDGARTFATELFRYLSEPRLNARAFDRWIAAVDSLPRKQTRVLTWPIVTVFGFIARPDIHMYLKPTVTRVAARNYGFEFDYRSRPNWTTYQSVLSFAETVRTDAEHLHPRDMIDLQSFIWVQGSQEYAE